VRVYLAHLSRDKAEAIELKRVEGIRRVNCTASVLLESTPPHLTEEFGLRGQILRNGLHMVENKGIRIGRKAQQCR